MILVHIQPLCNLPKMVKALQCLCVFPSPKVEEWQSSTKSAPTFHPLCNFLNLCGEKEKCIHPCSHFSSLALSLEIFSFTSWTHFPTNSLADQKEVEPNSQEKMGSGGGAMLFPRNLATLPKVPIVIHKAKVIMSHETLKENSSMYQEQV